ncbi:MAG: hypothetical protein U5K69_14825 [Balneolaceae bacterium]|nr:hypothetical protein [Balneolaceae bacterium]
MKRLLLILLVAAGLTIAGCGSDDSGTPTAMIRIPMKPNSEPMMRARKLLTKMKVRRIIVMLKLKRAIPTPVKKQIAMKEKSLMRC